MYLNREFKSTSERMWPQPIHQEVSQSPGKILDLNGIKEVYDGKLSYLEFVSVIKKMWEEVYPSIPILPMASARQAFAVIEGDAISPVGCTGVLDEYNVIITYGVAQKKAHTGEPKPRMRQNVLISESSQEFLPDGSLTQKKDRYYTIYGQKFQSIINFNVLSKIKLVEDDSPGWSLAEEAYSITEQVIDRFEDFMIEMTPIFKMIGASELVFARRLADVEITRNDQDIIRKSLQYMLTTEKTFAAPHGVLEKIAIDARTWLASDPRDYQQATPNLEDIDVTITDLYQTATPVQD